MYNNEINIDELINGTYKVAGNNNKIDRLIVSLYNPKTERWIFCIKN